MPTLLCSVRDCHRPLAFEERSAVCERGHSFDIARSGYVNLLQPQDRRSAEPGDTAKAVAARRRFLDRGFEFPLVTAIVDALELKHGEPVLDAGCGEGHHLGAIRQHLRCDGHGLDISVPAIDAAARRHADLHWVIANADRFVPFANASFAAVVSITARMNAPEFRRVVRGDGILLVVIPAPDDLIELREGILGEGVLRDRIQRTRETFAPLFAFERHERTRHTVRLDRDAIEDVMTSSYRALRHSERARLEALDEIETTLSRDLLLFRPS